MSRRQFLQAAGTICASTLLAGCARAKEQESAPEGADEIQAFDQSFQSLGSARSIEEIVASGTLVAGVCSDAKPYAYLSGWGNYIGIDVVFADAVAWYFGTNVRYVETDPADAEAYLLAHKVDAVFCTSALPGSSCLQATPYLAARQAVIAHESAELEDLASVAGKRIAVCAGTFADRFLKDEAIEADVRSYASYTTTFQALKDGNVDALCADQLIARTWVKSNKGYTVFLDNLGEPCRAGVLVAEDNEALLEHMSFQTYSLVNDGRVMAAYDDYVAKTITDADYKQILLTVEEDV